MVLALKQWPVPAPIANIDLYLRTSTITTFWNQDMHSLCPRLNSDMLHIDKFQTRTYCVLLTGPFRLGRCLVLACIASKVLSSLSISPRSALTCSEICVSLSSATLSKSWGNQRTSASLLLANSAFHFALPSFVLFSWSSFWAS